MSRLSQKNTLSAHLHWKVLRAFHVHCWIVLNLNAPGAHALARGTQTLSRPSDSLPLRCGQVLKDQ